MLLSEVDSSGPRLVDNDSKGKARKGHTKITGCLRVKRSRFAPTSAPTSGSLETAAGQAEPRFSPRPLCSNTIRKFWNHRKFFPLSGPGVSRATF